MYTHTNIYHTVTIKKFLVLRMTVRGIVLIFRLIIKKAETTLVKRKKKTLKN